MEQTKPMILERPTNEFESEIQSDDDGNALLIPDGGWGWVVCFAGFMMNFTIFGLVSSNGIILLGLVDLYGDTVSKTAIVGSIFMGIVLCVGPFVLLLMMFNASHRQIIICGGFLSTVSTIGSFYVNQVEVLYVTYGILSGFFAGMSHFSCNTIVGSYFKKKRTLAVGIANTGGGIGAFILNYLIERSISFYGMRGTFLLMSGLFLNFVVYGALCRPLKTVNMKNKMMKEIKLKSVNEFLLKPESGFEPDEKTIEYNVETKAKDFDGSGDARYPQIGPPKSMASYISNKCIFLRKIIFDPDVMKNSGLQLHLIVYFFWTASKIILIYLPAKVVNVGLTREQGALIMSIYGVVIAFSQIVVGILADLFHIPVSYLLMSSLFGMSVTSVAITLCHSFWLFILCASLFAICHGFSYTLRMVLVASILGVRNLTKGYSPLCLLIGLTDIIDTTIAGFLLEATQSYDSIFYFTAASLFIACILSSGIVYLQRNGKFHEK